MKTEFGHNIRKPQSRMREAIKQSKYVRDELRPKLKKKNILLD